MKINTVICVVGPTASGKSEFAVKLAQKINSEIISADSRQVYTGMDIGSGKINGKFTTINKKRLYVYQNIVHYGIDITSPKIQYSVARFKKMADKAITSISKRDKIPIICGGTGFWIDTVVYNQALPQVKPNLALRQRLTKLSTAELFFKLQNLDPKRAKHIDRHNPRRLIRAIEIIQTTNSPVPQISQQSKYNLVWLGLMPNKEQLHKNITRRLKQRIKQGLLEEVQSLHRQGLTWSKLESFGLEYKFCALFLQQKITKAEFNKLLLTAIKQYSKRQITWFKRNKQIHWATTPQQLYKIAKQLLMVIK